MEQWMTRRQKIIELLSSSEDPIDLERIADIIEIPQKKIILEDLYHIDKSLLRSSNKLFVIKAKCIDCGFIFDQKFKLPSRCPKCKSSRIYPPQFRII